MLADGHFTDRVADADDVVTLGKVHRIFAGGLLHRYLFHPDAYHAVDFELATGRSILDDDLVIIGADLNRIRFFVFGDGRPGHGRIPLVVPSPQADNRPMQPATKRM